MADLDLYTELVEEDEGRKFTEMAPGDTLIDVRHSDMKCLSLETEVEALNARIHRLETERTNLLAIKDRLEDNFSRLALACRREVSKLKERVSTLCLKLNARNPQYISNVQSSTNECHSKYLNPEQHIEYSDFVAYLHSTQSLDKNRSNKSELSNPLDTQLDNASQPKLSAEKSSKSQINTLPASATNRYPALPKASASSSNTSINSDSSKSRSSSTSSSSSSSTSSSETSQKNEHSNEIRSTSGNTCTRQSVNDERRTKALSPPSRRAISLERRRRDAADHGKVMSSASLVEGSGVHEGSNKSKHLRSSKDPKMPSRDIQNRELSRRGMSFGQFNYRKCPEYTHPYNKHSARSAAFRERTRSKSPVDLSRNRGHMTDRRALTFNRERGPIRSNNRLANEYSEVHSEHPLSFNRAVKPSPSSIRSRAPPGKAGLRNDIDRRSPKEFGVASSVDRSAETHLNSSRTGMLRPRQRKSSRISIESEQLTFSNRNEPCTKFPKPKIINSDTSHSPPKSQSSFEINNWQRLLDMVQGSVQASRDHHAVRRKFHSSGSNTHNDIVFNEPEGSVHHASVSEQVEDYKNSREFSEVTRKRPVESTGESCNISTVYSKRQRIRLDEQKSVTASSDSINKTNVTGIAEVHSSPIMENQVGTVKQVETGSDIALSIMNQAEDHMCTDEDNIPVDFLSNDLVREEVIETSGAVPVTPPSPCPPDTATAVVLTLDQSFDIEPVETSGFVEPNQFDHHTSGTIPSSERNQPRSWSDQEHFADDNRESSHGCSNRQSDSSDGEFVTAANKEEGEIADELDEDDEGDGDNSNLSATHSNRRKNRSRSSRSSESPNVAHITKRDSRAQEMTREAKARIRDGAAFAMHRTEPHKDLLGSRNRLTNSRNRSYGKHRDELVRRCPSERDGGFPRTSFRTRTPSPHCRRATSFKTGNSTSRSPSTRGPTIGPSVSVRQGSSADRTTGSHRIRPGSPVNPRLGRRNEDLTHTSASSKFSREPTHFPSRCPPHYSSPPRVPLSRRTRPDTVDRMDRERDPRFRRFPAVGSSQNPNMNRRNIFTRSRKPLPSSGRLRRF